VSQDIYGRTDQNFAGSFSADGARLIFAAGSDQTLAGGVGLITQQLSVQYAQQVNRIYEVGSNNVFLVQGRSQGQMGLARVLGPRPVQAQFYRSYGNVCNAANNNIGLELAAGCQSPGEFEGVLLLARNVVIVSAGFAVAAMDQIVNENLQTMFIALDFRQ
jgi:hypothetical protein